MTEVDVPEVQALLAAAMEIINELEALGISCTFNRIPGAWQTEGPMTDPNTRCAICGGSGTESCYTDANGNDMIHVEGW